MSTSDAILLNTPAGKITGFTLIELSIVLVIIGLIVGGILVGQDLIKAAAVRATVAQVESYNTAVNTFRGKYNALPGDMAASDAAASGLFAITGAVAGSRGYEDNNGLIEGAGGVTDEPEGELVIFWRHLSDANLINGAYGSVGGATIDPATGLASGLGASSLGESTPVTKLSSGDYFVVYGQEGTNYFEIVPLKNFSFGLGSFQFSQNALTPVDAFNIDVKTDDGMPNTGSIRAMGITDIAINTASWQQNPTHSNCLMGGTAYNDPTDMYNRSIGNGDTDTSCALRFKFN